MGTVRRQPIEADGGQWMSGTLELPHLDLLPGKLVMEDGMAMMAVGSSPLGRIWVGFPALSCVYRLGQSVISISRKLLQGIP